MKNTAALIEAFLFWKNEPVTLKKLSEVFSLSIEDTQKEIENLKQALSGRGVVLMEKDNEVMLGIATEASELIERLTKEELSRELSKAALETLSIVLYKGPVRRSELDYIRGVNSQFILRHLEIRGLVEKIQAPNDNRAYLYRPTFELLSHLGLQKAEDLPEYEILRKAVDDFNKQEETHNEENTTENTSEDKRESNDTPGE